MRPLNGDVFPHKLTVDQHTYCSCEIFLGLRHFGSEFAEKCSSRHCVYVKAYMFVVSV